MNLVEKIRTNLASWNNYTPRGILPGIAGAMIVISWLLSCSGREFSSGRPPDLPLQLTIYYTGNMTGNIEPCG